MTNPKELERAKRWMSALPRSQFDLFLVLSNDSYKRGEKAGGISKACEADELRAILRELVAQIDEEIEPSCCGKPFNDALNAARAALGEKQ